MKSVKPWTHTYKTSVGEINFFADTGANIDAISHDEAHNNPTLRKHITKNKKITALTASGPIEINEHIKIYIESPDTRPKVYTRLYLT